MRALLHYFVELKPGKLVLWYYLIWYWVTVYFHFDPKPSIWINALGISAVIGIALMLSVGAYQSPWANPWQTFRLFWMPFAVSSFSSLIKGQGYIVIFSPRALETGVAVSVCLVFTLCILILKWRVRRSAIAAV